MEKKKKIEISTDIYWFLWGIQRLLDNGKTENLEEIIDECEKGKIYQYITEKYEIPITNNVDIKNSDDLNILYANTAIDLYKIENKYDVHKNGLVYLSVIAIEWLYLGFEWLYDSIYDENKEDKII